MYLRRTLALHIPEEGGLRSEEAVLQVLLQAAVPTAHAAVHRHLAGAGEGSEGIRRAASGRAQGEGGPPQVPHGSSKPTLAGQSRSQAERGAGHRRVSPWGPRGSGGRVTCSLPGAPPAAANSDRTCLSPRLTGPLRFHVLGSLPRPARRAPSRHLPLLPASPRLSCPWYGQSGSEATSSRKVPQSPARLSGRPPSPLPQACASPPHWVPLDLGGQWT